MNDTGILAKVSFNEDIEPSVRDAINTALLELPPAVQKLLNDNNYEIYIVKNISTLDLEDVKSPDNIFMNYIIHTDTPSIFIPTETLDLAQNIIPALNVVGSLRNAIGHVVDSLAATFMETHVHPTFSSSDSFNYAYGSDISRMSKDVAAKLAYYTENSDESRSETFAECFASLYGGGQVYTVDVMSKYFSAAMKRVKVFMEAVETGKKLDNTDNKEGNEE